MANSILRNEDLAQDAVQNAFIGIWKTIESIEEHTEKTTRAYVLKAVKHAALHIWNIEHKRTPKCLSYDVINESKYVVAEDCYSATEANFFLESLLCQLPEMYQQAFVLKHIRGMKYSDIAHVMQKSKSAVRQLVARARTKLRALYKGHE